MMLLRLLGLVLLASLAWSEVLEDAKRAFDAGNYELAASLFEKAHQQSSRCDILFFLGLTRYRLRQMDAALISFQAAGACDPKLMEAQLAMGEAYAERSNDPEAIAAFQRALKIHPDDASALRGAASVYLRMQDNEKAAAVLEKLVKADPADPQAHADFGAASVATGNRDRAESEFKAALRLKPDLGSALLGLGNLYLKDGNESGAIPLLEKAVEMAPRAYEPRFLLGSAYNRLGRFGEARTELEAAVRLGGEESEVYYHLARAYGGLGLPEDRQKALARYSDLTKKSKDAVNTQRAALKLMEQAQAKVDAADLSAALRLMEEARELRPEDEVVLFRLASVHYDLKHYGPARDYAQQAIKHAPTQWLYHYLLGRIESADGRWKEARASLEAAVRVNPSAAEAHNALGEIALRESDRPRASPVSRERSSSNPKEASYRANLESARRTANKNLLDRAFALFDQPHRPAEDVELHLFVIQAHLVQDGGVQVAVIVRILDRLVAHLVGGAVDGSALYAAAGEPGACSPAGCGRGPWCSATRGCGRTRWSRRPASNRACRAASDRGSGRRWACRSPGRAGRGVFMSPCASQAPLPPPAWQIWMNRTPCSASRRASSSCRPNSSVSFSPMP